MKDVDCSLDQKNHWNKAYRNSSTEKLGWYEDVPALSLEMIASCKLAKNAKIFIAGAGSSTLIEALEVLKNRIPSPKRKYLDCTVADLLDPKMLRSQRNIELWLDRAVVHFFTKPSEQEAYFNVIKTVLTMELMFCWLHFLWKAQKNVVDWMFVGTLRKCFKIDWGKVLN